MKNTRFYLIFCGLGVIIILLIIAAKFKISLLSDLSGKAQAFLPIKANAIPKLEIQNFKLVQTLGEQKQWELEASNALEYEEGDEVQIKNASIKFFKNNKVVLILKSKEGIVDLKTKNIRIAGDVDAVSPEGMELKTENLQWVSKDEKLVTDDNIAFTKSGIIIKGKGLQADVSLGKLQVKESVQVLVPRKR